MPNILKPILKALLPVLALMAMPLHATAQNELRQETVKVLDELDKTIEQKQKYREERLNQIRGLERLQGRQRGMERIATLKSIVRLYTHMQTESAMKYVAMICRTPEYRSREDLRNEMRVSRAEVQAIAGQYGNAINILDSIKLSKLSDDQRLSFFQVSRAVYGWMADYEVDDEEQRRLMAITAQYRDSILVREKTEIYRNIVLCDKYLEQKHTQKVIEISQADLKKAPANEKAYIYYNLANAYRIMGNSERQAYYLALASIADINRGVAEYEALPELAQLLFYEYGDKERSYAYLVCAMEDANYCKARLRTVEVSGIFPIIDRASKQDSHEKAVLVRWFVVSLGVAILALAFAVVYLRNSIKHLIATRKKLSESNDELQATHQKLLLADKTKEEYLARFLTRCRDYLMAFESYRRGLLKMAKNRQADDLLNALKGNSPFSIEEGKFYADFDAAFLDLYPDFIEKFNALLQPEARQQPKHGELLNPELRIFALIRLGETDSARIAHFLNYSLATIYNYRSKVRNKALGDKNDFEKQVAQL